MNSLYPKGGNAKTYRTWSRKGSCPGCKVRCGSKHQFNCKVQKSLLKQLGNLPEKYNEVRLRHGIEDDIVLSDGDMHLEDMTGNFWWLGFYKNNKRITFRITSKSKISVRVEEDGLKIKKVEQEE